MKKIVPSAGKTVWSFMIIVLLFGIRAQAQSVTLNVNLTNILSLTTSVATTDINYTTVADYTSGVTVNVAGQLVVSSNRNFDLKVKAAGDLTGPSSNTIAIGKVTVAITNTDLGVTPARGVALTTADQALASNVPGTMSKALNLRYSTPGGSDAAFFKPGGTYTTTLTYTATAL